MSDVTAEVANWWPAGTANSIGATYLHVVINTDVELSRLIYDCEPLVEQWDGSVGQPVPYDPQMHGGEIAVLKGLQGGVGHYESEEFRSAGGVVEYEP